MRCPSSRTDCPHRHFSHAFSRSCFAKTRYWQRCQAKGSADEPPNPRPRGKSRRRIRPRNVGPPKVIRFDSRGRPSPAERIPPPPRQPPSPVVDAITGFLNKLPGLRDLTPQGYRIPLEPPYGSKIRSSLGYGDWAADIELGDDWDYRPGGGYTVTKDTRPRYPNTNTPRDSFMRPIADPIGVIDRLSWDRRSREQRLAEEATLNRRESRAALTFAGVWLFLLPFGLGWLISRGIAEPVIVLIQENTPERLQLTAKMQREGARAIKQEALRLRMEATIGKAPPLTDEELFHHLQHTAHEFEEEKQNEIRVGLVNIISDSITLVTFLTTLALRNEGREILTNTIGRVSQGMSQTGKAFVLILVADTLMGYHSEEGWTASIEILSEHYMLEIGHAPLAIFVSTVPVVLDTAFKWWLFKGLNRIDPSASVTLSEIDRH